MKLRRTVLLMMLVLPLFLGSMIGDPSVWNSSDTLESDVVDLGNGTKIELGPNEVLHTYTISTAPGTRSGDASPMNVTEYGQRTDTFSEREVIYDSTATSTTNDTVAIPMGASWEGTEMFVEVEDLQENRTWLQNHDFDGSADNWT
ncbi:MAG: hypothetical protein ACXAEN_21375, partial [Candidatus Thorarchaeota archaeon]